MIVAVSLIDMRGVHEWWPLGTVGDARLLRSTVILVVVSLIDCDTVGDDRGR